MNKRKLILIGNGMAGMDAIEKIVKADPNAFDITVFGKENHPNYNRIMLSSVLQGEADVDDISIHSPSWYEKNKITLCTGEEVIDIDKDKRLVKTDKGTVAAYDELIIATGSNPLILPIPGIEKEGVLTFRKMEDCEYIIQSSKEKKRAVVIGGGLLGLEAAKGLLSLGLEVHVIHRSGILMNKQLDKTAASLLKKELQTQGMQFLLNKETVKISGEKQVERVHFQDGSNIETDMVVMSAGVIPNVKLAAESEIETKRGIIVNDVMETSVPHIYAIGECAEHRGITYGLVKPLYEQADILAGYLTGTSTKTYEGTLMYARLKISGVDVFSAGSLEDTEQTERLEIYDGTEKIYKKIILQDEVIKGVILYGDVKQESKLLSLISKQKPLSDEEKNAILSSAPQEQGVIQSLPASSHICNCNNVSKGEIIQSVFDNGLTTPNQVKKSTGASSSCGGCKPLVTDLLSYIHSDDFDEMPAKKTMCSCTDKTETEVVTAIQEQRLQTINAVMDALQWKNKDGCDDCVSAIHYYLSMIYPDYVGKEESLSSMILLEEDGTYAISPQHYGGVTNPEELSKIAVIAEHFKVPSIRLTPNQRMQLSGIKKEDLPAIQEALDIDTTAAGKYSLEPIQIYPIRGNCSCDKSTAQKLAISLEKPFIYLQTPWFITMKITTCTEDCVKVRRSDIGLAAAENGWEIYLAASRLSERNELLYVASTKKEAVKMISAIFQYYREGARFKETIGEWAERVTFVHLREVLLDNEVMELLIKRVEEDVKNKRDVKAAATKKIPERSAI